MARPTMTDDKVNRVIDDITRRFKYQPNPNACEPNCIYNILHELGERHDRRDIQFTESKVNQLCGYRHPVGPNVTVVVPNLNRALIKTGYSVRDRVRSSFQNLRSVLTDTSASYPIVGLSFEYLRDVHGYGRNDGSDHVVVVFKASDVDVAIYDPFEGLSPTMRRANLGLGKGVVVVPTSEFLTYWEDAIVSTSWMLWVRKQTIKEPTIESFAEAREVVVSPQ